MKAAEVHGARAGFCCRSGAGGTAAAAAEAATGATVEAATGAAVEAATGAAAKVTVAAVCCGSVRGATEVAVVNGWRHGRGGGGHGGGGVRDPNPSAGRVLGAVEEGIGEGGVAPIYPSDGESMLFSYEFVRTLLALASKVAVGELVAIEVLIYTTV